MRFVLTAGQAGDAPQAGPLIDGMPADVIIADTAYDADHFRLAIARKGALAVIPNNPSRSSKHPLDAHLYAQRHLVECCFSRLKQFRRVATRFEKTAANYLAVEICECAKSEIPMFQDRLHAHYAGINSGHQSAGGGNLKQRVNRSSQILGQCGRHD